jgi:hypothetical protein
VEVTSSLLTGSEQSSHTALEVNENKHITLSKSVYQNTTPSTSSELHTNKEENANKTVNNPSHQFLDYKAKNFFTDRQTSSSVDHNSRRLISENYMSAEPLNDTVMSNDALLKYRASLRQNNQQNDNFLNSLRQEPKNMKNLRFNAGDHNTQHKSISSYTDIYFVKNTSISDQQNTLRTSFHEDKTRHLKQQDHWENFANTEMQNKTGRPNTEKYDKKVTLNTELPQDNSQCTLLGKDPMEVAFAESYKQLSNKENDSTHNTVVTITASGKDFKHVPANHNAQKTTISLSDIWNLRFNNKHTKQLETNPHNHNYEQIISDQNHSKSCCKHTSEKPAITNRFYRFIRETNNNSLNNQLQRITTSTTKNVPAMSTEEMDNQSKIVYKQKAKNRVTNENLLENDVDVNTNEISNSPTAKDKAQPLKRILTNSLSGETRSRRSLSLYPIEFSKNSDSSSRNLLKDSSYLDQGSRKESNNLAITSIWPLQAIQNMLKRPALQQPRVEESEADSGMDFLKKQFQRAERLSKAFEWLIRFVKVAGEVDSYLRDRIRSVVRTVARLYDSDYDRGNYRSCD